MTTNRFEECWILFLNAYAGIASQTITVGEEEVETEKLRRRSHALTITSRIVENRMEKLRKIIEKADKAKAKIQQRKKEWDDL